MKMLKLISNSLVPRLPPAHLVMTHFIMKLCRGDPSLQSFGTYPYKVICFSPDGEGEEIALPYEVSTAGQSSVYRNAP